MTLGDKLRTLTETNFPENTERTVTYSHVEAELRIKFNGNKHKLPTAERIGWLIQETLKQMTDEGYSRLGRISTNIEAGIKMSISINARRKSQYDRE